MTIKIRKRQLKDKGRFALYLDIYAHQKQWQENLKLYSSNYLFPRQSLCHCI